MRRVAMTASLLVLLFSCSSSAGPAPARQRLQPVGEESIVAESPVAVPYRKGRLWGLVDGNGISILACKYAFVDLDVHGRDDLVRVNLGGAAPAAGRRWSETRGGSWGVVDGRGREIVPPRYDAVRLYQNRFVFVTSGGRTGLVDDVGTTIVPVRYDARIIRILGHLVWIDHPRGADTLYGFDGREIVVPIGPGEEFACAGEPLIRFTSGESTTGYGVVNELFSRVDRLAGFSEVYGYGAGLWLVSKMAGGTRWYGFVDSSLTKVIVPFDYDGADPGGFGAGRSPLARVMRAGRVGAIDPTGKEVVPLRYDYVGRFEGGYAVVKSNGLFGLVDDSGHEPFRPAYWHLGLFVSDASVHEAQTRGLLLASLDGHEGFVDVSGRPSVPIKYDAFLTEPYRGLDYFESTGLVWGLCGSRYALVDAGGNERIPARYDAVRINWEMWGPAGFPVAVGDRWGFVNRDGREVVPVEYDWIDERPSEGLIRVRRDGKYGLVDVEGRVLLDPIYDRIDVCWNGYSRVVQGGKVGFADSKGRFVVPTSYDDAGLFVGKAAPVCKHGKWGFVDDNGNLLEPPTYDRIDVALADPSLVRFRVVKGRRCGYVDEQAQKVTEIVYDDYGANSRGVSCWAFNDQIACVSSRGRFGFVDAFGNEVTPARYDLPAAFGESSPGFALVLVDGLPGFVDRHGREFFEP